MPRNKNVFQKVFHRRPARCPAPDVRHDPEPSAAVVPVASVVPVPPGDGGGVLDGGGGEAGCDVAGCVVAGRVVDPVGAEVAGRVAVCVFCVGGRVLSGTGRTPER